MTLVPERKFVTFVTMPEVNTHCKLHDIQPMIHPLSHGCSNQSLLQGCK